MADHVRTQIRDAAVAALTGLTTTGSNCTASRPGRRPLQDTELPHLLVYTNDEQVETVTGGPGRAQQREVELVVEGYAKKASGLDAELDLILKEVEVALGANQGIGGAKYVHLSRIETPMEGGEEAVGVVRMVFQVLYYTALGAPDVAL